MKTEEPNQDFEKLQHLLKLKHYENPPPRYFNDFSGHVLSRIRAGKTGARYDSFENIVSQTPWLSRLWYRLERQPALSGAVAVVLCGFMMAGVFLMEQTTPQNLNFMAVGETPGAGSDFATASLGNSFAVAPQLASSTNTAALLLGPNLFEQIVPGLPGRPMQPVPAAGLPLWQK
jgi:hypothetical protein